MAAWSWNGSGEAAPSLVTPCSQVSLVNLRKLCTHVLPKYFWSTINFTSHILYRRRESSQPLAPCTKVPKLTPLDLYIPNWMHIHLFFLPLVSSISINVPICVSNCLSTYLPTYLSTVWYIFWRQKKESLKQVGRFFECVRSIMSNHLRYRRPGLTSQKVYVPTIFC